MRPLASRALAVAIGLIVVSAGAAGRGQAPLPIEGGELFRVQLPFERIEPTAEQRQRWTTAPLTIDREPFDCDTFMNEKRAVAHFIVSRDRAGATEFWKLSQAMQSGANRCDFDDYETWSVVSAEGEPPAISPAAGEGVPIFHVSYQTQWGGRTTAYASHDLIIDARGPTPVLVARLSSLTLDGYCTFAEDRPTTSCAWDAARGDFVCTEVFARAERNSLLVSGTRLARHPGATGLGSLAEFRDGVGSWAESDEVGAVRLIADLPASRSGRRLRLFGARGDLGSPFFLQISEGSRHVTVLVSMHSAEPFAPGPRQESASSQSIPIGEYRLTGEPPKFRVQSLAGGGVRLLRVVQELPDFQQRTVYHLAIEELGDNVIANAVRVASSSFDEPDPSATDFDVCDPQIDGFASPARIRLAPLRIDYDVEPPFHLGAQDEPRPDQCVVGSHAVWQPGKGFTVDFDRAQCPQTKFRMAHVRPDGSMTTRIRPRPQ